MKKIVRRSHIKENFRANLIMEKQYTAQDAASDAADIFIPGVSAYKNFQKGDWVGGLVDAGLDVAGLAAGAFTGGLGYAAIKGARAATKLSKMGKRASNTGRSGKSGRTAKKDKNTDAKLDAADIALGLGGGTGSGDNAEKTQTLPIYGKQKPNTGFVNQIQGIDPYRSFEQKIVSESIMGNLKRFLVKGRRGLKRVNQLQSKNILGKERPQTGFGNRIQGIDPWRSGELRQNIPFYDTPVGNVVGRRAMIGYQGTARVPPSSLPEGKVYTQLQEMINKSIATREINNVLVTQDMAKNIVQLHEALNTKNKKILEENIQSKDGFFEVLDFSVRN